MVTKKGIVMKVHSNKVYLLTQQGDFIKVYINDINNIPSVGSEYQGKEVKKNFYSNNLFKYIAACFIFFTVILGGSGYAYYKPISTVTVSINPSLELKLNRWNKVVAFKGLNEDGINLLKDLNIKNKNIDTALTEIVKKAKDDKYITEKYINEGKIITLNIEDKNLSLNNFKNETTKDHLNLIINASGTTVFKNTDSINKSNNKKTEQEELKTKESLTKNNGENINSADVNEKTKETNNNSNKNVVNGEQPSPNIPIKKNEEKKEKKKQDTNNEKIKENNGQNNKELKSKDNNNENHNDKK